MALPYQGFSITLRHTTLGTTPLDEWSARRRDLYVTTHNTHNRQTDRHPCRWRDSKLRIPASEGPQTHAIYRAAKYEWWSYHSFLLSTNLIIPFIRDGLKAVTGFFSTGQFDFRDVNWTGHRNKTNGMCVAHDGSPPSQLGPFRHKRPVAKPDA